MAIGPASTSSDSTQTERLLSTGTCFSGYPRCRPIRTRCFETLEAAPGALPTSVLASFLDPSPSPQEIRSSYLFLWIPERSIVLGYRRAAARAQTINRN